MMKNGLGFSLLPGNRPSTVISASGLETLGWSFGRKHSLGSVKLSLRYESLRWSATTSIEKIAFVRKRLSIAATDRQRSAEIVATVTMG
jgi:hypothetical protein